MIPPDYTDVSQESPRECCANLAMVFRDLGAQGLWVRVSDFPGAPVREEFATDQRFLEWASRLERATKALDAEKSPPAELFEKLVRSNCGAHCWNNGGKPTADEHTPLCNRANEALRHCYGSAGRS